MMNGWDQDAENQRLGIAKPIYTPTTEAVRTAIWMSHLTLAEWDRWCAQHDAELLRQAADCVALMGTSAAVVALRDRADRIARGEAS